MGKQNMGGSQVFYNNVPFSTLVQYSSIILVGHFTGQTMQHQFAFAPQPSLTDPANATPKNIPAFAYTTREFCIGQVLKSNESLQVGTTMPIVHAGTERNCSEHQMYHAHGIMKSPIVNRFQDASMVVSDHDPHVELILFINKSNKFANTYSVSMVGGTIHVSQVETTKHAIASEPVNIFSLLVK